MRDAAGKVADAVDFLRLHNFLFEFFLFGDVAHDAAHQYRDVFVVVDKRRVDTDIDDPPVPLHHLLFHPPEFVSVLKCF